MKKNWILPFLLFPFLIAADEYHPASIEFWEEASPLIDNKAFEKLLYVADKKAAETSADHLEHGEAELATGIALKGMGFTYAATLTLGHVIKSRLGTDVAMLALKHMEEMARTSTVDEDFLFGEIVNDLEFDSLPVGLQDFVSFEVGMFDLLHGYQKWSDEQFKKITPLSYWDFRLKYHNALEDVSRDHIDSALERFSFIVTNDASPDDIRQLALHQQGRIIFEKGDYPQAYKILKKVKLNPRERGLILLERAWSKYYQKDYSKALGLLYALEAPYFDTSRSPEGYILKMIIFKELCHYDSVSDVVTEVNKRYGKSVKAIKDRQDLRRDQAIVNISVIDQKVEKWVNLLNGIKDERKKLNKYNWDKLVFLKNIRRTYDFKIDELRTHLDWILLSKTREAANQILDWQEQVNFLDYQTKLDSLRVVKPKGSLPYHSEEISKFSFDKTYWENRGEIWFDELEDYKVLIESRCEDFSSGEPKK